MTIFHKPNTDASAIHTRLKRQYPYWTDETLARAVNNAIERNKADSRNYNILSVINLLLLVSIFGCSMAVIVFTFMANWPFAGGFALLAVAFIFVFRKVPLPQLQEKYQ